ncbi:ATP-binding cassette domain-containing protein [Loktanella fryxellensis]|uniref:ATP-binding cassette domain-containing protein n=1 Tax=Loktanella fryxellensis TaxID=245187 RepID=UPI001C42FCB2|nr:ATP-binding cassette domain-containing protein [Loktanella fryxellensis]
MQDVSLTVPDGALLVLLDPSGCGKTTTLRMLAGRDHPTHGAIRFGDTVVADAAGGRFVDPGQRNAVLVFQSDALWPHMTVAGNLDRPLRVSGLLRHDRRTRVTKALTMPGVAPLSAR